MEKKEKIAHLQYIISRFDGHTNAVNTKGNVYLSLMTFLIGGTITVFYAFNSKQHCETLAWVIFFITLAVQVTGIVFILLSLSPFLKSGTKKLDGSTFFFGDVASYTIDEYKEIFESRNIDAVYTDLVTQAHQLAIGLKRKYRLLLLGTFAIGIAIGLMIVTAVIVIK